MSALTEERRWATVLFADLSGFTALSEQMDPEDVRAMVDGAMAKVGEVVAAYGGFVNAVMGDGLMALFGAPVAHGDDAERAVRAALEMQQYAAEQTEEFGGLPLRVGINTGEIMFAPVGPEGHRRVTAIGDVTNTAARLQSAAPQVGVLVGEQTYKATRYAFRYQAMDPIDLKGKHAPVPVWLAVEALETPAERPSSRTTMVGRESELGELMALWERVTSRRRPHLVTIIGPPGIGKTRLYQEFASTLESKGVLGLTGRCLPYEERTGYGAFAQQVKGLAGIYETDPPALTTEKLERALGEIFQGADAADVRTHLAALIGSGSSEIVADQQSLFYSVRRFVEALATRSPVLFVYEDIHWADQALLDLLRSLAERVREVPALFLTIARPDLIQERPQWGGGLPSYSAMLLEPLSKAASRDLALQLIGGVEAGAAAAKVESIAEGNPLFIEELAASVSDKTSAAAGALPTNLRSIISARLDSLEAEEKRLILNASVIGKVFWQGLVDELGGNGRTDELLDTLEAKDFIRRENSSARFPSDREFTFKHMLIREVAYSTLPKAARKRLHAATAAHLEQSAEISPEVAALLAHHYRQAGDSAKAVDYLLVVAENARKAWAKGEAISLYEEALELLGEGDRAVQVRLKKAETMGEASQFQQAVDELTALVPLLSGSRLLAAELSLASNLHWLANVPGTEEHAGKAMALVDSLGQEEQRGPVLAALCLSSGMKGDLQQAIALGDEALEVWPEKDRAGDFSSFIGITGLHRYWRGDFSSATDLNKRGYDLGIQVFHVGGLISNGAQLGLALAAQGKYEEALEVMGSVLKRGREIGPSVFLSRAMVIAGGVLKDIFDVPGAMELIEEGIELGKQLGFPMSPVQGGIDLVYLDLMQGEPGAAHKAIPGLRERAEGLKGFHQWLAGMRVAEAAAETALALGSAQESAEAAADALARAQRHGRAKYEVAARLTLGRAMAALGNLEPAIQQMEAAAKQARMLKSPQAVAQAASILSAALLKAGRDEQAAASDREAQSAIAAMAAGLPQPRREAFLERSPGGLNL